MISDENLDELSLIFEKDPFLIGSIFFEYKKGIKSPVELKRLGLAKSNAMAANYIKIVEIILGLEKHSTPSISYLAMNSISRLQKQHQMSQSLKDYFEFLKRGLTKNFSA